VIPFQSVWGHSAIQETYKFHSYKSQISVVESLPYLMSNLDRLAREDYQPNIIDIFHCRIKTTGIVELEYTANPEILFDVVLTGGQRSERKKWPIIYEEGQVVVMVVNLVEYRMTLYEDETFNRMQDSLVEWKKLTREPRLQRSHFILWFNKYDLFLNGFTQEQIEKGFGHKEFCRCFPEYSGTSVEQALEFIIRKFLTLSSIEEVDIIVTNAADGICFMRRTKAGFIVEQLLCSSGFVDIVQ